MEKGYLEIIDREDLSRAVFVKQKPQQENR
jgi:hypothetical protein